KTATVVPGADGLAESVEIDMGAPILEPARIPTTLEGEPPVERELVAGDRTFLATAIGMGNPHCVIYVDDVMSFPVEKYGPLVENHPAFPRRVNAEFVQVVSRTELVQRTWERGSGETWACGTGASAVCAASVITGRTGNDVSIRLLGGKLRLSWTPGSGVRLAGNAVEVFEGEMPRKWIEETSRK
ncbi:MAG: diaminopimelate epimerase, partial [Fibrobacterales bacterium]|nr:diaminopimelate epimerase [Fibrobacterales bacterium]